MYRSLIIMQYVPIYVCISGHMALVGLGLEPLHASVCHELPDPMPVRMRRTWGLEIASDGCSWNFIDKRTTYMYFNHVGIYLPLAGGNVCKNHDLTMHVRRSPDESYSSALFRLHPVNRITIILKGIQRNKGYTTGVFIQFSEKKMSIKVNTLRNNECSLLNELLYVANAQLINVGMPII